MPSCLRSKLSGQVLPLGPSPLAGASWVPLHLLLSPSSVLGSRASLSPHLLTEVKVKSLSCVRLFVTPRTVAYQVPLSMDFPGKNTGVGCHFLLQEIFRTQGLNPGLPHRRQTLCHLSHQGSPIFLQKSSIIGVSQALGNPGKLLHPLPLLREDHLLISESPYMIINYVSVGYTGWNIWSRDC